MVSGGYGLYQGEEAWNGRPGYIGAKVYCVDEKWGSRTVYMLWNVHNDAAHIKQTDASGQIYV